MVLENRSLSQLITWKALTMDGKPRTRVKDEVYICSIEEHRPHGNQVQLRPLPGPRKFPKHFRTRPPFVDGENDRLCAGRVLVVHKGTPSQRAASARVERQCKLTGGFFDARRSVSRHPVTQD